MPALPRYYSVGFILVLVCTPNLLAADAVRFNRDIRPILSEKCLACHGPDAGKRKAELRLDDQESALESVIVAGQPDESELVSRITSEDPELRMPPVGSGHTLTSLEIELLKRWIKQGARYDTHWSYVRPVRPKPPCTSSAMQMPPCSRTMS